MSGNALWPPVALNSRSCARDFGGAEPFVCVVCDGREFARPYPAALPWLARCEGCGLMAICPQPSDAELAGIYSEQYYHTFGCDDRNEVAYRAVKQATAARLLQLAERHFRPGHLLDVGSALGDMLVVAGRRGWEARGVEPNVRACALSRRAVPGAVLCRSLEEVHADAGPFDLVTCTEVLEHLRRPDAALARMRRLLRPGAGLLLTLPDVGCLASRLHGSRWWHYHREHLWYFNRGTLTELVARAGFQVIVCRRAWKVFNLRYIFGILAAHRSPWRQRMARLGLGCFPARVLAHPLPPLGEGLLLLACRPKIVERNVTTVARRLAPRARFERGRGRKCLVTRS